MSHGLIPFEWAARPRYRQFRDGWSNGVPQTFNEKVQYKMMHDRRPVVKIYSDKIAARDHVRALLPHLALPRLLGVHQTLAEVLAHLPPAPWVMKGSHGAGMVFITKPGQRVDPDEVARHVGGWLATDYSIFHWEWQYHRLPRGILFEEYLGTPEEPPADYKLFTLHQQVRLITVDRGRFGRHTRDVFRPDWTRLPTRKGKTPNSATPPARPPQLEAMIDIAQRLGQGHDFVRVDLYVVDGQIYFGELTHSPAAGTTPFEDHELDLELGGRWHLPSSYQEEAAPRELPSATGSANRHRGTLAA